MNSVFTMHKGLWCLLLGFLIVSCAKDDGPSGDLNGTYNGYYIQTGDVRDTAVVQLVMIGSNFSGTSTGTLRPICNGSFSVFGDSVRFKNFCTTPDSDLLLVGAYQYRTVGDSLYLTRTVSGDLHYEEHFDLGSQ